MFNDYCRRSGATSTVVVAFSVLLGIGGLTASAQEGNT
jgi:hypothetical protein